LTSLPVIVAYGGVNPAGRSSFHHAFYRIIYDALSAAEQAKTRRSLGRLMGLDASMGDAEVERQVLDHSLIRTIEPACFDIERLLRHRKLSLEPDDGPLVWQMDGDDVPTVLPEGWQIEPVDGGRVRVRVDGAAELYLSDHEPYPVRAAGQLPSGFNPGGKHPAKSHPRGLQIAIYAASDAVHALGIEWARVRAAVPGDQVAVYASSAMGQLDWRGSGRMLQSALLGQYTSSRNCPFGLPQMPADFINAYVLGNVGRTAGLIGACATFLYNLEKAVTDIQDGRVRVALVGAAEAPLVPEVIEGYRAMSALAEDGDLLELDGLSDGQPDHRRASRPFAENCGFAMGESGQYLLLMDDALALELGATIHGAVPAVFVHADGIKRSISSPGIGNYLSLGKAAALTAELVGERGLREHTLLHAHGTSTPQNRVTESHVFDRVAQAFGIRDWVVAAVKCFVGHSLGAAGGDAMAFALGSLDTGWVPGIVTAERFADDIHDERLSLSTRHRQYEPTHWQTALLNAKGFGGNNATGVVLSAEVTTRLLTRRHGAAALHAHQQQHECVAAQRQQYESALLEGHDEPIYAFGTDVLQGEALSLDAHAVHLPGHPLPVSLEVVNPYGRVD